MELAEGQFGQFLSHFRILSAKIQKEVRRERKKVSKTDKFEGISQRNPRGLDVRRDGCGPNLWVKILLKENIIEEIRRILEQNNIFAVFRFSDVLSVSVLLHGICGLESAPFVRLKEAEKAKTISFLINNFC